MKLKKHIVAYLMAIMIGFGIPVKTYAQWEVGAAIGAETAMSGIISEIKSAIRESLNQLDQTISSGTFLARMQLQLLLAETEYHANSVIDKTFGEIGEQQQAFFRNTSTTIKQFSDLGDGLTENVDTVIQRVEFIIGSIPLISNEPRLRSHKPRVIETPGDDSKAIVKVSIDGSWLANGKPLLSFGETECEVVDQKEPSAVFHCTASLFRADSGVRTVNGVLRLVDEKNWGQKWMGFIFSPNYKDYPLSIGVLPPKFGNVSVSVTYEEQQKQTNSRSMPFDTGARHCEWGSETLLNISPASGWQIDVNSIGVKVNSSNGGSHELRNVTNAGYQFYAAGRNSGNCVKALGQTISKDARGWHNGQLTWSEFKMLPIQRQNQPLSEDMNWGDSRVVQIPQNTTSYTIKILRFDRKIREYNAPIENEFIAILRDDTNRSLRIELRSLESAFK